MSNHNESSLGNQFVLEIDWGIKKQILVQKFSFGSPFYNLVEIQGQYAAPRNPLFVYPEDRNRLDTNPGVQVLKEFYETSSVLPRLWLKSLATVDRQTTTVTWYRFDQVRVLERFGRQGDRFQWFYKFEFSTWQ